MSHPIQIAGLGLGLILALGACDRMRQAAAEGEAVVAGDNACGAAAQQNLVGQRADVLNTADLPDGTRVLFPGMATTLEFSAERLNIAVNETDTIERVYCG